MTAASSIDDPVSRLLDTSYARTHTEAGAKILEHFDICVTADGGIDHLRQMILDLAVRGQLLGSDRTLPPASADGLQVEPGWQAKSQVDEDDDLLRRATCPPNWVRARLGAVVQLEYGKSLPKQDRRESGGIPVYGSNGPVGVHHEALVTHPCLIVGRKGSSGAVNLVSGPSWPIDTTYFVIAPRGIQIRFLYILFRALRLDRFDRSTAIPGLNRNDAYALTVFIPPQAEQDRIVARVDHLLSLCDEVEKRDAKTQETTTLLRQSVLDYLERAETVVALNAAWEHAAHAFPVLFSSPESTDDLRRTLLGLAIRGRLVPHDASEPALDLREISEHPFPVPPNWRWVRLEEVASDIVDCLHATPKYGATGFPAIRTADVVPGRILVDQARLVDEKQYTDRVRRLIPREGDILYSREGGRLGIAACVPAGVALCLSQRMMHIRVRPDMDAAYVMWAMNSRFIFNQATGDTGGSASPHVNLKAVRKFLIPVPPSSEQRRIVAKLTSLFGTCANLEQHLQVARKQASRMVEAFVRSTIENLPRVREGSSVVDPA